MLIAFLYLKQIKESIDVPLVGIIIGVTSISIGIFQYYKFKVAFDTKADIENSIKEFENNLKDSIEEKVLENFKVKINQELNNDSISKIEKDSILHQSK